MSEFQEYPKWVTIGENDPVLCEDAKAERKLKKSVPVEPVEEPEAE